VSTVCVLRSLLSLGDRAPAPAPTAAPAATPAPSGDTRPLTDAEKAQRKRAGWEQLARAPADEAHAPEVIQLPASVVEALERAWQDSVPNGAPEREQGGDLVRTYGGSYELRRGDGTNAGEYDQYSAHVGRLEDFIAIVHTHPYRDEQHLEGPRQGSFSAQDLSYVGNEDQNLNILRSGLMTFMVAKTKQFLKLAKEHDDQGTSLALAKAMLQVHNDTYQATRGVFADRLEAAVKAVCHQFHLLYYEGQGAEMHRVNTAGAP
jgi:hypothetical protein